MKKWPAALEPLKRFARTTDRGLGDIVARVIDPVGGAAFKTWFKSVFGVDCGCEFRQQEWNREWPL